MITQFTKSDINTAVSELAKEVQRRAKQKETSAQDLLHLTMAMREATATMAHLESLDN